MTMPSDPLALLRSRSYVALLVIAAIIGVPVSAAAYFFLALVSKMQGWIFTDLPKGLGFHAEPLWWPVLPLALAGVLVAATIRYLPGQGGHVGGQVIDHAGLLLMPIRIEVTRFEPATAGRHQSWFIVPPQRTQFSQQDALNCPLSVGRLGFKSLRFIG